MLMNRMNVVISKFFMLTKMTIKVYIPFVILKHLKSKFGCSLSTVFYVKSFSITCTQFAIYMILNVIQNRMNCKLCVNKTNARLHTINIIEFQLISANKTFRNPSMLYKHNNVMNGPFLLIAGKTSHIDELNCKHDIGSQTCFNIQRF